MKSQSELFKTFDCRRLCLPPDLQKPTITVHCVSTIADPQPQQPLPIMTTPSAPTATSKAATSSASHNPPSFASPHAAIAEATRAIFERWTALVLIIEHQLGGDAQSLRPMLDATISLATSTNPRCTPSKLANYLYAQFDRLNTDVEDGSPEQVAAHLLHVRDAAMSGDYGPALHLVQQATDASRSNAVASSVRGNGDAHGDDDDDDEDDADYDDGDDDDVSMDDDDDDDDGNEDMRNSAQSAPAMDADGFTEVRRSRRR